MSWSAVRELNEIGGVVTSRAVLADPPDVASMAEQMGYDTGSDEIFAIVALIIVMALIEVVLLAGPAFAVGARRHARTLALIAASGGTPAQSRRVILGSGVVLGLVASGIGLVLGIVAGWALLPVVQRFQGEWFGPVRAAVALPPGDRRLRPRSPPSSPRWCRPGSPAARTSSPCSPGVAATAARARRRPIVGLVLLGVGIAASAYGAVTSDSGNGALWIAASAVVSVLGMILVVPVVVSAVARVSGRLPLTARYAARDAARHRTRTVPAVAAVAATVAGVVALGIANASDERQNEMTYTPQAAMGTGYVSWGPEVLPGEEAPDPAETWARIEEAVRAAAPSVEVDALQGLERRLRPQRLHRDLRRAASRAGVRGYGLPDVRPDGRRGGRPRTSSGSTAETAAAVDRALADGRAVLFTTAADAAGRRHASAGRPGAGRRRRSRSRARRRRSPAQLVPWDQQRVGARPPRRCSRPRWPSELGLEVATDQPAPHGRPRPRPPRPASRRPSKARSTAPTSTSSAATSAPTRR